MKTTNNMITKILYQKRWMVFWWFIAFAGTAAVTLAFFPAFKGTNIGQVFNSLPVSVQKIVGDASSYSNINGYIGQEIFGLRAPLIVIILSIATFNSLMVSEERKGILETHISLPLSRSKILTSKLIAGIIIITISSLGLFIGTNIVLYFIHEHYSQIKLLELVLSSTLLGITFGLITVFLNSIFGVRSIVLGISCAYAFFSYLITSFALSIHSLHIIEKLSLFHFYIFTNSFHFHNLLAFIYVSAGLIIISYLFFNRRDIAT